MRTAYMMRKERKAQIQMFETIAVLVVFFFLIAFGLAFYFMISKTQAGKEYERSLQLRQIVFTQKISTLPELDCVRVSVQVERCFDKLKLINFTTILKRNETIREQYYSIFGNTEVTIEEIWPTTAKYELYSNKLANATIITPSMIPMLIQDPTRKTYSLGLLRVKLYA